jgi:hypothetical protein
MHTHSKTLKVVARAAPHGNMHYLSDETTLRLPLVLLPLQLPLVPATAAVVR